ncbi:MAG: hypothetical protein KF729_12525 [Sandaracinaceae bacterium]|nr:hypothetical protein [Sandaracinaceae bacterium]
MRHLLASLLITAAACDGPSSLDEDGGAPPMDAGGGEDAGPPTGLPSTLGPSDRPANFVIPAAHDGSTALPLLVLLHGYSASGMAQDIYLTLSRTTRANGFYLVIPDGTVDGRGNRFWNATPACCDFDGTGVDDVGYLIGLVDEAEALVPVRDVYFFGHSNGGFMSNRMACEHADRITAIGNLAGSGFRDASACAPTRPVSALQIHGDMDATIPYAGLAGAYPSAPELVARWATRAGCDDVVTPGEPLDLDSGLAGAETLVEHRNTNCEGADATLWTIVGGSHIPSLSGGGFARELLRWLDARRR